MSTNKFQYWPNNGQLGSTKFTIPTNPEHWPTGDALVGNFVYSEGELVDLVDIKALKPNTSKSTTIPYDYVNIELPFAEDAMTINPGPRNKYLIIKFNDKEVEEGGSVIVTLKYKGCKTLADIKAVDPNYKTNDIIDGVWNEGLGDLTNGSRMLFNSPKLITFSSDLSSLTYGQSMFYGCENLTSFSSDLSSLTDGDDMFSGCSNLTSFSSDLSSLRDAYMMFKYCSALTSFSSDLSSLTDGRMMFYMCENLTSFNSNLASLTDSDYIFWYCKLDAPSVKNIIDTINTYSGELSLGIGCENTTEDKDLFAQEIGYTDMTSLLAALQAKGWTVEVQYTGRPTTTYSLRRPSENTLPIFARLEEVEKYATHTSEDGSKKYMLNWFHETTGSTEGYTQFASLEEAVAHFNIKPIER